jgi:hypothetical protein
VTSTAGRPSGAVSSVAVGLPNARLSPPVAISSGSGVPLRGSIRNVRQLE